MDVLHHKRFGCYAVYDKDLIWRDESDGFWSKNGRDLDFSDELALMQPYSCVKGIEYENSGARYFILQVL